MPTKILAMDQGTTSTRAILFDERLDVIAIEQQELPQYCPHSGWVEHDPEDLWNSVIAVGACSPKPVRVRTMSPRSASPTSARPPLSGIAQADNLWAVEPVIHA